MMSSASSVGSATRSMRRWRPAAWQRRPGGVTARESRRYQSFTTECMAMTHETARESGRRLSEFDRSAATAEQLAVLDEILSGPRGSLEGPFLAWIRSPELATHAQRLGAFCRYRTGLPTRLSELAILVTAAHWRAQAEWQIHHPIALDAGLPADVADALLAGRRPAFDDPDDELIYAFATELYETRRVGAATYEQAIARFGDETVTNLVALLGYYALVAMTLNVFEMRVEGRGALPFPEA
jgi:4-carboxymuconolactone decarboxylase